MNHLRRSNKSVAGVADPGQEVFVRDPPGSATPATEGKFGCGGFHTLHRVSSLMILVGISMTFAPGCGRKMSGPASAATSVRHEHRPPHGGTPIVLGNEAYHLELVLDSESGALQAFVLDGEMENFIRCDATTLEIDVTPGDQPQTLMLAAVANPATGETVGDTALFEAHADWLKTVTTFDGLLKKITIRDTTFADVKFTFPKGNAKE